MAWTVPEDVSLGFFVRKPEPGLVKTRLAEHLGEELSAAAYRAMLEDLVGFWSDERWVDPGGGRRVLAFAPEGAGPWFDGWVPRAFALRPQVGEDLGARMAEFFEGEFEYGSQRVVLMGSDAPTLDATMIVSALLCLEANDVVLGPAMDGGYYLVAARGGVPPIFDGVDWGSTKVLSQTLDRLEDTGLKLAVLPPWYDVDTPEQWQFLITHLRAMRRAGMHPPCERLEAFIASLGSRH
jgi:rSAM/selenodomain-associated transferase 1